LGTVGSDDAALGHCRTRKQFGKPLIGFQLVQAGSYECSRRRPQRSSTACGSANSADQNGLCDTVTGLAKMHNTSWARHVIAEARDRLGRTGVSLENHVSRHIAGIEAIHTFECTETFQTLIVGRDITGLSCFT
jgi:glutaryl-CoA dehydrogenase